MSQQTSKGATDVEFFWIGTASALPIAGYFLLEWPFTAVVLLFWLEAVIVLLFYAGLAMFATPEQRLDERENIALVGPIGGRYFSEEPRQLVPFTPPVYPKNLRFVAPTTLFGLFMAFVIGGSILGGQMGGRAGRYSDESTVDFLAQFAAFESPSVLVAGLFIVAVHLLTLTRYYFGTGRYRELTAYMALEVPVNYYVLYFYFSLAFILYALATFFVMALTLPADFWLSWEVVVAGSFLVLKLAFERSRFRGERQPDLDDDSFTSNFSPTSPPAESIQQRELSI